MKCKKCKIELECVDTARTSGAVYRLRQCNKCRRTCLTIEIEMDAAHPIFPDAMKRPRIAAALKRLTDGIPE